MPDNKSLARLEELLSNVLSPRLASTYIDQARKAVAEARECEPPLTPEECAEATEPLFTFSSASVTFAGDDPAPDQFHSGENRRAGVPRSSLRPPGEIAARLRDLCDDPDGTVLIDYEDASGNLTTDREIVPREYVDHLSGAFIRATNVYLDEPRTFVVARIRHLTVEGASA